MPHLRVRLPLAVCALISAATAFIAIGADRAVQALSALATTDPPVARAARAPIVVDPPASADRAARHEAEHRRLRHEHDALRIVPHGQGDCGLGELPRTERAVQRAYATAALGFVLDDRRNGCCVVDLIDREAPRRSPYRAHARALADEHCSYRR
jgi:hypothetical protein